MMQRESLERLDALKALTPTQLADTIERILVDVSLIGMLKHARGNVEEIAKAWADLTYLVVIHGSTIAAALRESVERDGGSPT